MAKTIRLGSGEILPWDAHPSLVLLHQLKLFNFPIPLGFIFLQEVLTSTGSYALPEESSSPFSVFLFDRQSNHAIQQIECKGSFELETIKFPPFPVDALVLENEPTQITGMAVSRSGYFTDEVSFQIHSAGETLPAQQLTVDKLAGGESPIRGDFRGRLQLLMKSLRRSLGEDDFHIQWKDDGETLFLTLIQKNNEGEALGLAVQKETFFEYPEWNIIKSPIPRLKGELIEQASPKLSKYFLHWAKELSSQRKLVIYREGKILFNMSFLKDFLTSYGIPSRLLFSDSSFTQQEGTLFRPSRTWKKIPRLLRFFHELTLATGLARRVTRKISQFETSPDKTFLKLFHEWQSLFVATSHALYRISFFKKLFFFPKSKEKNHKVESQLRLASAEALLRVEEAIQIKALGWYSRGILSEEKEIWTLCPREISEKEALSFSGK